MKSFKFNAGLITCGVCIAVILIALFSVPAVCAEDASGMQAYKRISKAVNSGKDALLIKKLDHASKKLNWDNAEKIEFQGNLRIIGNKYSDNPGNKPGVYLLQNVNGGIFILDMPRDPATFAADSSSAYASIDDAYENEMTFKIQVMKATVEGETYTFARLLAKPEQPALDKIFKTGIVLLLFFVMVGMIFGILFSKLSGVNNYQTRAISLETGLRNSALAMTIALLIQDPMGDFYSSMLITSAVFGATMFMAGAIAIFLYKFLLPLEEPVKLEDAIE